MEHKRQIIFQPETKIPTATEETDVFFFFYMYKSTAGSDIYGRK